MVARIWITDTGVLVAAYGFVAAAVAFSIQDFFKNFVGGLILLLKGNYKVGDRVMIKEITGDVIDISLLYTSLLEIEGWVAGDQPTGRIVMIPNSVNLSGVITNYTEDHTFIWDEMHIPVPYGSDWEKARDIIKEITNAETDSITQEARPELEKLRNKYFLSEANIEPSVYIKMTDNWISLHVRYITKTHERRIVSNILSQKILKALNEAKIEIASATMEVTVKNR